MIRHGEHSGFLEENGEFESQQFKFDETNHSMRKLVHRRLNALDVSSTAQCGRKRVYLSLERVSSGSYTSNTDCALHQLPKQLSRPLRLEKAGVAEGEDLPARPL